MNINKTQSYTRFFFTFFLCLIPFGLITGPFIPDSCVVLIGIIFLFEVIKEKKLFLFKNKIIIYFFIFYLVIVINSLFSINVFSSFWNAVTYIRFLIFSLAIFYYTSLDKKIISYFFYSLFISLFIVSIDASIQILVGKNLFGMKNEIVDRISGLFGDEYVMGSYLARLFPLCLALMLFLNIINTKVRQLLFFLFLVLIDVIVFYSGERTSFVLLLVSQLGMIICVKKFKILRIFSLIVSLLLIGYFISIDSQIRDRMYTNTKELITEGNTIQPFSTGHKEHYRVSLNIFLDNPFFGSGVKSFRYECQREKYYRNTVSCSTHPHNTYIQFLAETGIFGFVFLILSFTYVHWKLLSSTINYYFYKKNYLNDSQILLLLTFAVTLFPFSPSGNFFNNWLSVIYFLPLGFYFNLGGILNYK